MNSHPAGLFRSTPSGLLFEYHATCMGGCLLCYHSHTRRFGEEDVEEVLEDWLEKNTHVMLDGEPVLYIGRQVPTDLGKYVDLLAVNGNGDTLIIELKKDRTSWDIIAQALEYAAYVSTVQPDAPRGLAE